MAVELVSPAIERAILRTILLRFDKQEADILDESDFAVPHYRQVFAAIQTVRQRGAAPDLMTVAQQMGAVDGGTELETLIALTAGDSRYSPYNLPEYVRVCRDLSLRRKANTAMIDLHRRILDTTSPQSMDELLAEMAQVSATLSKGGAAPGEISLQQGLKNAFLTIMDRQDGKIQPVSCGITALDNLTGGIFPGEVTVIGARPATGKSVLALQIAIAAAQTGKRAAVISREMTDTQISERVFARGGVPMAKMRTGKLREEDWEAMSNALTNPVYQKVWIDNRANTVSKIRTLCRRMIADGGLDILLIDYLQLLTPEGRSGTRNEELARISWGLKETALDLKIPVVVLSQLNRNNAKGGQNAMETEPNLSDLRDSGAIEQDADNVWLLWSPGLDNASEDARSLVQASREGTADVVRVKVAKARQSATGSLDTVLDKSAMIFIDPTPHPMDSGSSPKSAKQETMEI